ncbi:MAG: hypothetical protein WCV00_02060 [Verrucomicrobiia bacterium]
MDKRAGMRKSAREHFEMLIVPMPLTTCRSSARPPAIHPICENLSVHTDVDLAAEEFAAQLARRG